MFSPHHLIISSHAVHEVKQGRNILMLYSSIIKEKDGNL